MRAEFPMKTRPLITGIAALFLATGAAHAAEDTRKWVWRCSFPHTPSDEQMEEHEQCCKQWPNVPHCNGHHSTSMPQPQSAKLPNLTPTRGAYQKPPEK